MNYRFEDLTINVPADVARPCLNYTCFNLSNCGTPSLCNWRTMEPCKGFSICPDITKIGCPQLTLCAGYTLCRVSFPCKATLCAGCTVLSPIVLEPGSEVVYPEILQALRDELTQALEEVDAHQQHLEQVQPELESGEQLDKLIGKLEGALNDLRERRQRLE